MTLRRLTLNQTNNKEQPMKIETAKMNMKPHNSILILILIVGVALTSKAWAVAPAPDGGYPGGNTAEGQAGLFSLTTGRYNTAVGFFSLRNTTETSFNTGVGAGTLLLNTGDENTAMGAAALLSNTTGGNNTATGAFALFSNTTASGNTAIGSNALLNNTTGGTLENIQGLEIGPNVAVGAEALRSNTIAGANTAVGYQALGSNTTGLKNSDFGGSTAVGFQSLANATGPGAGMNDAFGYQALFNLADGFNNVAIGTRALFGITAGSNNVALGTEAGEVVTTGGGNICIGAFAGSTINTASNVIAIGTQGANVDNSCYIGSIFGQPVGPSGVPVSVDSDGKLGTILSSRRFKKDIQPMDKASEAILSLKPVRFQYKSDTTNTPQFGLVAEEVAEVNPGLVVRDKNGEIYTVRYDQVNAMLLNEFLKEHKKVERQEACITELNSNATKQDAIIAKLKSTVARQQDGMDILATQLKEQAAQIQQVSARLEVSKSATRYAGASR
jgi:uncharacterized coiled-coil protein SlyX